MANYKLKLPHTAKRVCTAIFAATLLITLSVNAQIITIGKGTPGNTTQTVVTSNGHVVNTPVSTGTSKPKTYTASPIKVAKPKLKH